MNLPEPTKFASGLAATDLNAKPDSIWDIIEARARAFGDKPFLNFIDQGEVVTYYDAYDRAGAIGRGLREFGIGRGDKVGLLLGSSSLHVYAWFATLGAAMVDVPINSDFRGEVLDHAIRKIDVTALFADQQGLEALATASPAVRSQIRLVVVSDGVYASAQRSGNVPDGIGRFAALSEIMSAGAASRLAPVEVDSRALASIRFSSGT